MYYHVYSAVVGIYCHVSSIRFIFYFLLLFLYMYFIFKRVYSTDKQKYTHRNRVFPDAHLMNHCV
jgi:uncharacterized membrane protein YfcA